LEGSREAVWCNGTVPGSTRLASWESALAPTFSSCSELQDDWERAKPNIRTFYHTDESFGGAAPQNGDWMIVSEEWLGWGIRASLTHELLHLNGESHSTPAAETAFIAREKTCGGKSALEAAGIAP
jgi:hypothetical protein